MKPRHQRLALIAAALAALAVATYLILSAFQKNLVFFFTPTQVIAGAAPSAHAFRLGGMVEPGSLRREPGSVNVDFTVTDLQRKVPVRYSGVLPDLFKEGKGVVAQGRLKEGGIFLADEVLAKHDENYMPPEAAFALRQAAGKPAPGDAK